jgi:hypothetical protein
VQRETDEEMGQGSPCHLCASARDHNDLDYLFGVARVLSSTTHWGGAVATLALNALTVPLGVVVGALPGTSSEMHLKQLRLVMCATCGNRRKGSFWNNHELKVTKLDCSRHPAWKRLYAQGYTTWLDHRRLQQVH